MLVNCCGTYLYLLVLYGLISSLNARPSELLKTSNLSLNVISASLNGSNHILTVNNNISHVHTNNRTKTRILTHSGNIHRGQYLGEFTEADIIFPDQVIHEIVPKIIGVPQCADSGGTFCENFSSYPYHHVKDVLERNRVQSNFFGEDEIPENININNRVGVSDDFICDSLERTVFPRIGKNRNNQWKFIVNQDKNEGSYIQGVRTETCLSVDLPCKVLGELPGGYTTSCKQKYMYRRMMAINDSGSPEPDTFQLPSACCCTYRQDADILSRFGARSSPRKVQK